MYEPNVIELAAIKYRVLHILPFSSLLSIFTLVSYFAIRVLYMFRSYKNDDLRPDVWNSALYLVTEIGLLCKPPKRQTSTTLV